MGYGLEGLAGEKGTIPTAEVGYMCRKWGGEAKEGETGLSQK
jgi:hypothetical protein